MPGQAPPEMMAPPPPYLDPSIVGPAPTSAPPPPFTMEELGLTWPNDRGMFTPSSIPVWLQEQVGWTPISSFHPVFSSSSFICLIQL